MRLQAHDEVTLVGVFYRNPVTGKSIDGAQQLFAVTTTVEGDEIPPFTLWPCMSHLAIMSQPIPMSRVDSVNGRSVELQAFVDGLEAAMD